MRQNTREDYHEAERQSALRFIKSMSNERFLGFKPVLLSKTQKPDPLKDDPEFYVRFNPAIRTALIVLVLCFLGAFLLRLWL